MIFEEQKLEGIHLITPEVHYDSRGYFLETFRTSEFKDKLNCNFVQDNEVLSLNTKTIRGLHYQLENSQAKLVHVVSGSIFDVVVDLRIGSSNFGDYFSINLSSKKHQFLFIPSGYAHGYLVLEQNTVVQYKCTDYYNPKSEYGIRWDDPKLKIPWGVSNPVISKMDNKLHFLKDQQMLPLL